MEDEGEEEEEEEEEEKGVMHPGKRQSQEETNRKEDSVSLAGVKAKSPLEAKAQCMKLIKKMALWMKTLWKLMMTIKTMPQEPARDIQWRNAAHILQKFLHPRTRAVAMVVWKKGTNGMGNSVSVHPTVHSVVKPSCQARDMQPSNVLRNLQTYD